MAVIQETVKIKIKGLPAMKRKVKNLIKIIEDLQKMEIELKIK